MACVPRIARMTGGAFACPESDANNGADRFRTIREQDAMVAAKRRTNDTISKGITQRITAGTKGVKEYPYMQTHSTS